MKSGNKTIAFILIAVLALGATSCLKPHASDTPSAAIAQDREGNPITLPKKMDRVISLGPSNTEILAALGFADKIVAADAYSGGIEGLADDIPLFSMMAPDGERILRLEPDVIFVTGMSKVGGVDQFKIVSDAGICVLYIPSSSTIADIKADITFIAEIMGNAEKGGKIIAEMEEVIGKITRIADTITDRKTVYFEISAESFLYSFGRGVFLNEMLEIIGAENILVDRKQWVSVTGEAILAKNPDVILTNNGHIDNPVDDIMARPGWNALKAVQNGDVHYIDTATSSRPSHNIVRALQEMAKAVYPDKY